MRLEDQGKEVKKTGFLRGTRMWAVRNRIMAGFSVFIGVFYTGCIVYAAWNVDYTSAKHEKMKAEVRDNELKLAERTKIFENRHMALQTGGTTRD